LNGVRLSLRFLDQRRWFKLPCRRMSLLSQNSRNRVDNLIARVNVTII